MPDEIALRTRCGRCGHAWSFHGKSFDEICKAMGCRGGDEGCRCPGFIHEPPVQS